MNLFGGRGTEWYAVQAKPRLETKVLMFLQYGGIPTFLPRLLVHRRHGSRRWESLEPLFPGYLFARFALQPTVIDQVRRTPGVKRLLGSEDRPVPVPENVVTFLQERLGERGYIVPGPVYSPGTRVRFKCGPFALLEGIIERHASRADRARVLFQLMNTAVVVEADLVDLEAV